MANKPENLKKYAFKKGEDPRRHKKQKGEISWKRKFIEDYKRWCQIGGKDPSEKVLEYFDRLDKLAQKDFRALQYLLDRIYGKAPEKIESDEKIEEIKKIEEALRKWAESDEE